jgi:ATP-dependent protease ClpP protease subunit
MVTTMIKNRLIQLFKDNEGKGVKLKVEQEGDDATIYLYDAIGDWYGVSAKDFVKELSAIDAKNIHLRINCPGGDVFEARTIATALRQHKAKITSHIDGVCASAATYIALSANEVEMAEGAFFMIHRAWCLQVGDADDMRSVADLLDKVDASIVVDYSRKTGMGDDEIMQLMTAETWFTATEALENKFIDRIYESEEVENNFNLSAYDNAPEKILNGTKNAIAKDDPVLYDRERFERRLNLIEALR